VPFVCNGVIVEDWTPFVGPWLAADEEEEEKEDGEGGSWALHFISVMSFETV
jgi:hypothetical protein